MTQVSQQAILILWMHFRVSSVTRNTLTRSRRTPAATRRSDTSPRCRRACSSWTRPGPARRSRIRPSRSRSRPEAWLAGSEHLCHVYMGIKTWTRRVKKMWGEDFFAFSEIIDGGVLGDKNNDSPKHSIFRERFIHWCKGSGKFYKKWKNLKGYFSLAGECKKMYRYEKWIWMGGQKSPSYIGGWFWGVLRDPPHTPLPTHAWWACVSSLSSFLESKSQLTFTLEGEISCIPDWSERNILAQLAEKKTGCVF